MIEDAPLADKMVAARSDYNAGRPSIYRSTNIGTGSRGRNADYHYRESLYLRIVELSRDLFRDHCVFAQGIRRFVANVIQGGFTLDPQTGNDDANALIRAKWKGFSTEADQCDLAGELTFQGMERLVLQHTIVDGDIVGIPHKKGPIQLFEGHRLRKPTNTRHNVVMGVLLDDHRRRLQYWMTNDDIHPSAALKLVSDVTKYDTRDADGHRQVFHVYFPDRVTQTRGVPAIVPAADTAGMTNDLLFAQLVKAQAAACYTIFHEMSDIAPALTADVQHGERTTETRPDGTTRTIEGMGPGTEVFGFAGEKLTGFSPNVPNPEFFPHVSLLIQILALNLDMPLILFLLDARETNFSGWRGAMDQAKLRFRACQQNLISRWHRPVYECKIRQWIAEDAASGGSGLFRFSRTEGVNLFEHRWNTPQWPYIEPLKDATSDLIRTQNALISQRRRCHERGMDWEDLSTEIADDNGLLIAKAARKARDLNSEFPGLNVTWRDVASLPMASGIKVVVGGDEKEDSPASNQKKEPANAA